MKQDALAPKRHRSHAAIGKVLVVDDSRAQRRIVSSYLQKCGLDVSEADSGVTALALCQKESFDLVISDWVMPEMDGLSFCEAFRRLPMDGYGYFILLTSKSDKADIAKGFDAGVDDFLTKPVNPAELRARISAGDRIVGMQRELTEKNRLVEATLSELQDLYDSIDSDLIEAKKLQQSLVSERHRRFPTADVSILLRSAGHVGGDLVGFFPINEDQVGLFALDVSGHGISSALMTARLAGYLSSTSPDQNLALEKMEDGEYVARSPSQTIADLNQMILGELETEHYFTLLLAVADLTTGKVVLSQAGHPYPVVQRSDGRVEPIGGGGLPVGLVEGAIYDEFEVTLSEGDRLLIHSDGVDECANPAGELLGQQGVLALLEEFRHVEGMAFLEALVWKLSNFARREEFGDDVSAVLLEFKGCPEPI